MMAAQSIDAAAQREVTILTAKRRYGYSYLGGTSWRSAPAAGINQ